MPLRFNAGLLCILCLTLMIAGCGKASSNPKGVPVSGTVTYNGAKLTKGIVTFAPDPTSTGSTATGEINSSGTYTMGTFEPRDGVIPGKYLVTIKCVDSEATMDEKGTPVPAKWAIPEKYGNGATSELSTLIEAGGAKTLNFDLK